MVSEPHIYPRLSDTLKQQLAHIEPVAINGVDYFPCAVHTTSGRLLPCVYIVEAQAYFRHWPRPLMWAFEWYDTKKDLVIKRGDPWFYLQFETTDPTRRVRLVEAAMTDTLQEYLSGLRGVTNYVNRTFSLFRTAQERRPKTLLTVKQR